MISEILQVLTVPGNKRLARLDTQNDYEPLDQNRKRVKIDSGKSLEKKLNRVKQVKKVEKKYGVQSDVESSQWNESD